MDKETDKTDNNGDSREESINKIRRAVKRGLSFDQACSLILVDDAESREAIIAEALMLLIEEMHCSEGMPLKQLAMKLRISMSRAIRAKENMVREREEALRVRSRKTLAGRLGIS